MPPVWFDPHWSRWNKRLNRFRLHLVWKYNRIHWVLGARVVTQAHQERVHR